MKNLGKNRVFRICSDDGLRWVSRKSGFSEHEVIGFFIGSVGGEEEFVEVKGRVGVGLRR